MVCSRQVSQLSGCLQMRLLRSGELAAAVLLYFRGKLLVIDSVYSRLQNFKNLPHELIWPTDLVTASLDREPFQ